MLVFIVIGDIDDLSESTADAIAASVARAIDLMASEDLAEFALNGFDDDPREIWEIPEARNYFITFSERLIDRKVDMTRVLPQTLEIINACYATRAGHQVVVRGTAIDTIREALAQVVEHARKQSRNGGES
jgi:hypothetical protein